MTISSTENYNESYEVYALMSKAQDNIFGPTRTRGDEFYSQRSDRIMGPGFYDKNWGLQVTQKELELLRLYAGPHGYAIWKAKQAREEKANAGLQELPRP